MNLQQPCQVVQSPNRSCYPVVDVNITPTFQTTKNLALTGKRTPKHIQVDESELTFMECKVPKCTILRHCSQIMKQYFDKKYEAGKWKLFLSLIKSRSMETVRINLGIRTLKNIESSNHIVHQQVNFVYLNVHHNLCLYIQIHLKNIQ